MSNDLNTANLRIELSKLRQGHKAKVDEKKEPVKVNNSKAKEYKDKDVQKQEVEQEDENEIIATPDELEQIKHIFINLLV